MAQSHQELELQLKKKIIKNRVILCSVAALFLVMSIIFAIIYYGSAEPSVIPGDVYYTKGEYSIPMGLCIAGFVVMLLVAPIYFMSQKFSTVEIDGQYITINKSSSTPELYVDGELKDKMDLLISDKLSLDARLKSGVIISVYFSKYAIWNKITFSDGRPPMGN